MCETLHTACGLFWSRGYAWQLQHQRTDNLVPESTSSFIKVTDVGLLYSILLFRILNGKRLNRCWVPNP